MSMKTCCFAVVITSALSSSVQAQDDLMNRAKALFKPIPEQPPETASNPFTPDKVETWQNQAVGVMGVSQLGAQLGATDASKWTIG